MEADSLSLVIALILVFSLLGLGVYIGIAMGIAGIVGIIVFTGSIERGLGLILDTSVWVGTTYGFLVIPMFVMLGVFASISGIAADLFRADYRWVGHLPGGLAITTVITCAALAAVTGSSLGAVAAMMPIALPEMKKYRYNESFSVGTIAVAGTLAIMIPPSVTFVIYAIFAEQSIGKLLISGILPGLLLAALYSIQILIRCTINPDLGPKAAKFTWRERWNSLAGVIPFVSLLAVIFLGILFGIWTPVESAAVGALVVFIMVLFRLRGKLTWDRLVRPLVDAVVTNSSIMILVVGCMIFSKYLSLSGISEKTTNEIIQWGLPPISLYALILMIYLILGMFLEATSIIALTVPLLLPVVKAMGWDPIWFGVIVVSMMEVAAVTPPVGLVLYVVKGIQPELSIKTISLGCLPFWLCNMAAVVILYLEPRIALFLPSLMSG